MLLTSNRYSTCSGKFGVARLALYLLLAPRIHAQEPKPPCVVEVPVYGPFGDRLPFRVSRVTLEGDNAVNLLSVIRDGIKATSNGDHVYFSSDRIVGGRAIEVALVGPKGAVVTSHFVVTSCRLRRSLFFGQSHTEADVWGVSLTGRLSGCTFDGDWWVRAVPMFGGPDRTAAVDGYVHSDGTFWLVLGDYGVRYLLIIGKAKEPVKVISVDVTVGKKIDTGVIGLSTLCPK